MAIARLKPGHYPAILSYGFRPFFLAGALYAGLTILLWLPLLRGRLEISSLFAPMDWHAHEMLYGYLPAVMTGFLLTAIPNWSGRLPVQGLPLLGLAALWLIGRLAVLFSAEIGWLAAAAIDCAFLLAVVAVAAREIVAGKNWRNLKVLAPVTVLCAANILFHWEAHHWGIADIGRRLGLAAAILLIMIIGGRIIPSFTHNWLTRENPGRLPVAFNSLDMMILALSAATLIAWTFLPARSETGVLLIVAAAANGARLTRWAGARTWRDPLVLILHIAYGFVPFGLLLAGLAALAPETVPPAAAIHAFGAGAIGAMTLAVMIRATLGHTGRALKAGLGGSAIFAGVLLAALLRLAAVCFPATGFLIELSAAAWAFAFFFYAVRFGGMLLRPRMRSQRLTAPA
ncbi:NnrS family protein [Taklimakanibacter deserti]|uniref:NnrS family protein n=1 Tax=Taklimakanibacter deserti TaxID=2267839 RepID=UPI000E648438